MSINFPNSPAIDQIYTTPGGASFVWNGTQWVGFSSTVNLNLSILNPLLVKDNGTTVGTVTAINFADYLDVTYADNSIDVDVNHLWQTSEGGIYNLTNTGIGTTNPSCLLEIGTPGDITKSLIVNGGIEVTGLTTIATSTSDGYVTIGGSDRTTGVWVGYYQDKSNLVFGLESGSTLDVDAKRNIFIGDRSGRDINGAGSSENIVIGAYAGLSYSDANNNVFIGNGVGNDISQTSLSGSYNVIIGPTGGGGTTWSQNNDSALLLPPIPQGSYQLVIGAGNTAWIYGNSDFNVGFGTELPTAKVEVAGGVKISGIASITEIQIGLGYTYSKFDESGLHLYLDESNYARKIYFESYYPGYNNSTVTLEAPEGAENYSLLLPTSAGNPAEVLTSDGEGNLYWSNPGRWSDSATGVYYLSHVGIGTTNATSDLTIVGNVDVNGIITATSFNGSGSSLTGIVTSITAGSGITINQSMGNVTVSLASTGGTSQWVSTAAGIHTLSNVGIGTTNPTSALTVKGNTSLETLNVSGVSTFTSDVDVKDNLGGRTYIAPGAITFNAETASSIQLISNTQYFRAGSNGASAYYFSNYYGGSDKKIFYVNSSGPTEIYHGEGNKRLETLGAGVTVTGTTFTNQLSVSGNVNIVGLSTFTSSVRVGVITSGLGTSQGVLINSDNGSIISNNTGSAGGYYLRRNGTNIWYVDYLGAQFNTGKLEVGPIISNPNITLDPVGNANFSGIVTATTLRDNIGNVRSIPQNRQTSAYVLSSTDAGKHVAISTGGITLNSSTFSTGDIVTVYNDSIYTQMINVGAGVTLRRVSIGDAGSRGLNAYGLVTILCIANNSYVISGAGLT